MNALYSFNLTFVLPAVVLSATALLVLLAEAFSPEQLLGKPTRLVLAWLSCAGLLVAALVAALQWREVPLTDPAGMLRLDPFTSIMTVIFCGGAFLVVLLSHHYLEDLGTSAGEYYCLLLFATTGAYFMAAAYHLIMVFLGLEVLSVAIYPLAGFIRRDQRSNEAAIKYFLLGAFSSAFFLYGMALIYGGVGMYYLKSGSTGESWGLLRYNIIAGYIAGQPSHSPIVWAGIGLLIVSFAFKAALVPFHMWTPDAYDGAPTPVTAYMGAVVKAAAFAPFFRFVLEALGRREFSPGPTGDAYRAWSMVLIAISVLTMTWGNLAAVAEPSIKRMLAYSSVAHAGYIAIALVAESYSALVYYLAAYTLMVIGSFGCVALVRRADRQEAMYLQEWSGLTYRHPWLGAAMALFLFALAGFPPTAGFMAKLIVFRAALQTGATVHQNGYVALVAIALINSLVSVYYYLRVVVTMLQPVSGSGDRVFVRQDRLAGAAIAICAVGVLLLGLFPQKLLGALISRL